jgi:hypothetical protein
MIIYEKNRTRYFDKNGKEIADFIGEDIKMKKYKYAIKFVVHGTTPYEKVIPAESPEAAIELLKKIYDKPSIHELRLVGLDT